MKSSKYQYRVVTAPGGEFAVQIKPLDGSVPGILDNPEWVSWSLPYRTLDEAKKAIERGISQDNFVPEVVAI